MASGDTIPGSIRVILEDTQGNRNVVIGSLPQNKVDYTNQTASPEERTFINTMMSSLTTAPSGAQKRRAPDAVFEAGEKLIVQHNSAADNTRDIDVDFDAFGIEGVIRDLNRGNSYSETLTQNDQELTADPDESAHGWVDFYQFTVPDRQRYFVAGEFEAVAIEV